MKVMLDGNGYVENFVIVGNCPAGAAEAEQPEDFDMFYCRAYKLENGALVLDEARLYELKAEEEKAALRDQRGRVCFPVINRGELWYEGLSETQRAELAVWYRAWLDVTETGIVPEAPAWLKQGTACF